jgi:hypothetical protein
VENGKEVLDLDYGSSVLNAVLKTINNKSEHGCLNEVIGLRNTHTIHQIQVDQVSCTQYTITGLPRPKYLVHQVLAIWYILRNWVWDSDMPGVLLAHTISLGKTFTSVAVAMICKLHTEKFAMEVATVNFVGEHT